MGRSCLIQVLAITFKKSSIAAKIWHIWATFSKPISGIPHEPSFSDVPGARLVSWVSLKKTSKIHFSNAKFKSLVEPSQGLWPVNIKSVRYRESNGFDWKIYTEKYIIARCYELNTLSLTKVLTRELTWFDCKYVYFSVTDTFNSAIFIDITRCPIDGQAYQGIRYLVCTITYVSTYLCARA